MTEGGPLGSKFEQYGAQVSRTGRIRDVLQTTDIAVAESIAKRVRVIDDLDDGLRTCHDDRRLHCARRRTIKVVAGATRICGAVNSALAVCIPRAIRKENLEEIELAAPRC